MENIHAIINATFIMLSFCYVFEIYCNKKINISDSNKPKYIIGIILGLIISALCPNSLKFTHISIDMRTVPLCLAGLYFGKIPTIIATIIVLITTLIKGNTIPDTTSEVVFLEMAGIASAGIIGLVFGNKGSSGQTLGNTLLTATIVHLVYFTCLILVPSPHIIDIAIESALVILVAWPIATLPLSMILNWQKKRYEIATKIRQTDDKINKIAMCSDDCFWEIDNLYKISYVSDNIADMIGFEKDEVLGRSPSDLLQDIHSKQVLLKYAHSTDSINKTFEDTLIFRHKKGHNIYCEARGSCTIDPKTNTVCGYIGIIHNVTNRYLHEELSRHNQKYIREQNRKLYELNTELKRVENINSELTEQLVSANEKIKEANSVGLDFISMICNEIYVQADDISRCARQLLENVGNSSDKNLLCIEKASNIMQEYICDISDCDKITRGELLMTLSIGNVEELINDVCDHNNARYLIIRKKAISIKCDVRLAQEDKIIKTDFTRLAQVIGILINNAMKYVESGQIVVVCDKYNDNELLFEVADTGMGIPSNVYSEIFNRQLKVASMYRDAEADKTMLSLYICKEIVELLGGKIWYSSQAGLGTTFRFTIPYIKPSEFAVPDNTIYNWKGKNILVVGSSRLRNIMICEAIAKTGAKYQSILCSQDIQDGKINASDYLQHIDILVVRADVASRNDIKRIIKNISNDNVVFTEGNENIAEICSKIDVVINKTL